MSKNPKKKELKLYTISETIYVTYQIVATSEEDAQDHYRNLPSEEWNEMVSDGASNNFCDDEVVNDEAYDPEEHGDEVAYPRTEAAKKILK
jgi:hypothetical protein